MINVTLETPEFKSWMQGIIDKNRAYMAASFPSLDVPTITATEGSRYIRVMRDNSAHAFIDRTNGDVLKPASWKAPAKHARGNIFDTFNGLGSMGPYGPAYLR
jgi:hypothetical protein